MDTKELKKNLRDHAMFISGSDGGRGADIRLKDLRKLNLDNINLKEAVLTGCNFSEGSFINADLRGADLYGCTLSGANLTNAKLDRADMRGALLDGANLENASMVEVDLRRGQIAEVGWKLRGAKLSTEEKERGEELKENIGNTDLSNAKAQSADLQAADLQSANFENANLSKANLTRAKTWRCHVEGC